MLGLAEGTEPGYQLLEIVRAQALQGNAAGVYVRSARCFGKCAVKVAQKSVSYTHLDVYKRQGT